MANDILGSELNIDGLEESIARIEKRFTLLSRNFTTNANKIRKTFEEISTQGVGVLASKLDALNSSISKISVGMGLEQLSRQVSMSVDEVNKLIQALGQLNSSQLSRLGNQQNKLDYKRYVNDIKELKVLEDERGRALTRQNKDNISANRIYTEQLKTATMQAVANEKERQAEIKRSIAEINRLAKAYKSMPTSISSKGVGKLVNQSMGATTINQRLTAIHNLRNAIKDLDTNDKRYQATLAKLNSEIKRHEKELEKAGYQSNQLGKSHRSLMNTTDQLKRKLALLFSVSAIKGYVNKLISVRGEFELQQRALSAILQSKNQADKLWNQTVKLAVKSPFTVGELTHYTKQLAAYRIETEKLHDTTKRLADVSAGLGVDMQRLILAFGQVRAASYLRGTELRQFTEAGIPMLEELASYFTELEGRAVSVGDVFGRISKRLVAFSDVEEVFKRMTSAGGVFYEMQEKQAESLKGMMSNLKDRIDLMLNDIGSANDGVLKDMVGLAQSFVANWKEVWFRLKQVILLIVALKAKSLIFRFLATETGLAAKAAFTATTAYTSWGDAFTKFKVAMLGLIPNFSKLKASISGIGASVSSANLSFKRLGSFLSGGLLKGLNLVRAGFNALKVTMSSFLPFLAITAILELYNILTEASRAAKELQEELNRIDVSLGNELSESIATYKELATTMRDLTKSYAEREEAMKAMKRAFGEILPDQMLELEYIRGLDNAYTDATDALKEYYNNKAREQKVAKIDESFEKELSSNIDDLYDDFASLKVFDDSRIERYVMDLFGLDEKHVRRVMNKLVEDVKKGTVEIGDFQKELFNRINKMFNVEIVYGHLSRQNPFEGEIDNITETLQRYKDSVEAVTGLEFETIEQEKQSKEFQRVNKLYEERKAKVDELRIAYSNYYTQLKANKAKGELVTNADKEKLMEYRMDINELYQQLNLPMRPWEKFSKITNSLFDIEKEIEIVSGTINNRFIKAIEKAASQNVKLDKFAEKLKNINDSFTGTDLQQTTEEAFRLAAEMYEIPLNSFDKLKVDGKKSVEDFVKNVESEFQRLEKVITEFDHAMTAAAKLDEKTVEERTSFVEKSLGYTTEEIELFKQQVPALKFIFELFGGIFKNIGNKGNSIWEQRISLLKELRKEYEDLSKTFNETTSRQKVMNGYMEAANELFKDLGIDISQIPFDDLERMSAFVSELMKEVKEGSKDQIKLGKLKGFFDVDIETKDTKDYQEQLIKQMQNLFDNYELGKELEKLHLPKELMKQLFDVDVLNLDELRDRITSMDISNFGEDALKEYDKLLDKIREMELKEQEERMKMYSKYLIKAQNERVKIKMDELKHIQDIEKTFAFNDDNLEGRFNLNPNAVNEFKTQLSTLNVSWDEAFKHLEIYRDLMLKVGFTDEQINQLKEYNDTLKQSATTAKIAVRKESKEKLDKQAWKDFTGSDYYIEIFADLDKVSTSVIKSMMERLKSLKGSLKLDPTEMKQVVDAMEKMDKEVLSREGFSFKKIVGGVKDYIKYLRERNGLEEAYNASQERIKNLEFNRDMQIDAVAKTKEEYDLAVKMHGATSDEAVALSEELVTKQAILDATLAQLVAEGKISAELAKRIKEGETTKVTLEERLKKNAQDLNEGFSAFEGMMQSIQSVTGTFGDDVNDFMENVGKVIGGIATVENGLSQVLDGKVITGAFNMVSGAFQSIGGLFGFVNNDKKKERQIQKEIEFVEKLEKAYEKLEQAIENAYSVDTLEKSYDNAIKNINDQIKSYNEMIALEESKKDTDSDKIDEWKDKIEELRETQKQLLQDQVESLGGSYDIRSTTREFVDAWLDAFRETGSGLDGLKDNFKEFFQNILLEQAVMKGGATIMESLLTEINNSLADNFKIDSAEYDVIKQKGEITMEQLNEFLNGLLGEGGLFNEFMTDAGDNLSGLQKGIQGISESTAQVIEAYLNSVRFYVADSNTKLTQLVDMQTNDSIPNPMLAELKAQTELIRGIRDMFSSVIRSGHPTYGGAFLKVAL